MKHLKPIIGFTFVAAFSLLISSLFSVPFIGVFLVSLVIGSIATPSGVLNVVVSNPLIGKSKKSMGNVTFSTWKGINVLKEKPTSVANPRSDDQEMRRSAFSQIVEAFRQIPAIVRIGFKKLAVKKSEFNAFVSYNLKNAFDYTAAPSASLYPEQVLISRGTIAPTPLLTAVADRSANTITVTYSDVAGDPGQSTTDRVIIAAYNGDKKEWTGAVSAQDRADGTAQIVLPADWATGEVVWIYAGFYNQLTGESSDSTNLSGPIVA
jgi:hypothetical protein